MKCFVIMPFDSDFDDVYDAITTTPEGAIPDDPPNCCRLDEKRPAGRITDRLVRELKEAAICVADLMGTKPNVMWEVGYAMALGKPLLVVTQSIEEIPFDIKDEQCIEYNRGSLGTTLTGQLGQAFLDILGITWYCGSVGVADECAVRFLCKGPESAEPFRPGEGHGGVRTPETQPRSTLIQFNRRKVYIRHVLTHQEYSRGPWKS